MKKHDIIKTKNERDDKMAILTANCKKTFVLDNSKLEDFKKTRISRQQEKHMHEMVAKISKRIKVTDGKDG